MKRRTTGRCFWVVTEKMIIKGRMIWMEWWSQPIGKQEVFVGDVIRNCGCDLTSFFFCLLWSRISGPGTWKGLLKGCLMGHVMWCWWVTRLVTRTACDWRLCSFGRTWYLRALGWMGKGCWLMKCEMWKETWIVSCWNWFQVWVSICLGSNCLFPCSEVFVGEASAGLNNHMTQMKSVSQHLTLYLCGKRLLHLFF